MTATIPSETKSSSRRALLDGEVGGLGALAASAFARPRITQAHDVDDVWLGNPNSSNFETAITNSGDDTTVFSATSTHAGIAIKGTSTSGTGVDGSSTSGIGIQGISSSNRGVYGQSISNTAVYGLALAADKPASVGHSANNWTGLQGFSGAFVLPAAKAKTGVYGYAAQDNFSRGVTGESPAGIGVYGISSTGYGGYFGGRVYTTQFYELGEIGTPAAPLANRARLFVKDNGAGKTQLCVRFNTGAVQVIASQP